MTCSTWNPLGEIQGGPMILLTSVAKNIITCFALCSQNCQLGFVPGNLEIRKFPGKGLTLELDEPGDIDI